ncbi:MAG: hypothetical protein JNK15_08590, partial [Planctomycetes bacterium]|nr:hypothetical protein [Planctomycetota bacterium]
AFTTSRRENFGSGCPAVATPFLTVQLPFAGGTTMQTQTNNIAGGAIGGLVVGFSEDSYASAPLPLLLDPLLGTVGCRLHVSADLVVVGVAAPGQLQVGVFVPPAAAFQQFYVQTFALTNAPGGFSFSQGVRVRSSL